MIYQIIYHSYDGEAHYYSVEESKIERAIRRFEKDISPELCEYYKVIGNNKLDLEGLD